jgi:hypothetical protein
MVTTVVATNDCGCTHPDPLLANSECEHLLCHECTDLRDAGQLDWDGAPRR